MAIQYSQFSSPLSRNARKPSVVINDGSWNPNDTVDYATGQKLIPTWNMPEVQFPSATQPSNWNTGTWNMPDVGGYTAPARPAQQTINFTEGLPSWTMPNITPTSTPALTPTSPTADNAYALADQSISTSTGDRTMVPFRPMAIFGIDTAVDADWWASLSTEEMVQWYQQNGLTLAQIQQLLGGGQQGTPTSGGSGVDPAYATALREYIAGIQGSGLDYGKLIEEAQARYGGYGDTLTADVAAATAKQQAAAQQARQALLGLMPTTVSNVTPTDIGAGSVAGYLQNIGASTRDVDAVRAMEQQMLNQSLASTQAYTQRLAAVDEANRLAQQAAVETILQEASSGLATNEQVQRRQYAEALAAEVERLRAAEQAQQNDLATKLLEARLMAAQSGVTL